MTVVLLGLLVETTGGCATASLLEMGDARAMMLLPLTLTFDAIHFGILSAASQGSSRRSATVVVNPAVDWHDPDDWVASCAGPLFCPDHKHFVCTGEPDACTCACEVTLPETTAEQKVASLGP